MIDSETGYNDELVCNCKPCDKCEGEGEIPAEVSEGENNNGPNCRVVLSWKQCPKCKGAANITDDCEIEAHWPAETVAA